MSNLYPVCDESLNKAAQVLRDGGIVAFPTETVYGLGADAFNPLALAKVFEAKNRPSFDPLIIHIAVIETLEKVANLSLLSEEKQKMLFLLAEHFWPGPLSIILPKNDKIPPLATAGLETAAIRFPSHVCAQKLIALSTGAIAAPSANPFGALSPTLARHVQESLGDKVDLILDGGPTQIGVESTVLDITCEQPCIFRHGGATKEAIESVIGFVCDNLDEVNHGGHGGHGVTLRNKKNSLHPSFALTSPGQLKSHYAPKTSLKALYIEEIINLPYEKDAAWLFFDLKSQNEWENNQKSPFSPHSQHIKVLSPSSSPTEAASRLFETLHELDSLGISRIFAQYVPQEGIGAAINDRLRRAQEK